MLKTSNLNYTIENFPSELSSDHSPIILYIHENCSLNAPPKPLYTTDWDKFEKDMSLLTFSLPRHISQEHLDASIYALSNTILSNLAKNSSLSNQDDKKHDLPIYIRNHISTKRKLRSAWQRTRDPAIKSLFNKQSALVKDLLLSHKDDQWTNFLSSIDNSSLGWSKLFKLNRRLLRKNPPDHPLQDSQGNLQYDSSTKANIFASCMEDQFKSPPTRSWVDDVVRESIEQHDDFKYQKSIFFTPGEIWNELRRLPNNSAPGLDQVSNRALKHSGKKVVTYLCEIFNACARMEYFPRPWKHALIVMLPKPGKNPTIPNNHRPISLLNSMGKILEKLILNRLKIHIMPKIRPEQFGFRPQHSTTIQLSKVLGNITDSLNKRHRTATVFLDFEKAFDKVWHDGLLFKLLSMNIPSQLTNIIRSFLNNRTFQVKVGGITSSVRKIQAGVPQGSCLSPHLFSVYINDIPTINKAKIALFADDTLFYSTSARSNDAIKNLQSQINVAIPWFKEWKISINPNKTKAIHFSNRSPFNLANLKINNVAVNWSKEVKYLGVTIDNKLHFTKHVREVTRKANGAKFALFPLLNPKSPLPLKTKLYIYKAYIRPIITYAGPSWVPNISNNSWRKIESLQSKIIRSITDNPWYVSNLTIRNSTDIPSIREFIKKDSINTSNKILSSNFSHISDIITNPHPKELFHLRPFNIN